MAPVDQRHLQEINLIVESLGSCECKKLVYLCESFDSDSSAESVKDLLKSKVQEHGNAPQLFLTELTWRLGRFDIMKRVFKVSRNEVEQTLRCSQVLSRFRVLMTDLSEDLNKEDLEQIKFLLSNQLSREKMNTKSFLDVLIELERLDLVSPERVDIVEECFRDIGRVDLSKKVTAYKMSVETSEQPSSREQNRRAPVIRQGQPHHIARMSAPLPVSRLPSIGSPIERYRFNTNPRGLCVIIDCVGKDGVLLEQTFKALHFNVVLHRWLSADETLSALRSISLQRENHAGLGFVCCVISRGTVNQLLGTDAHGDGLPMNSIRRLFTADACPMLAGKPKLFFIQRYSIPELAQWAGHLETDGCDGLAVGNGIPTDADVFWSHCWTDEHQLVQEQHHSVYLKALTDALHKAQRRKTHLLDVHTEVNGAIFEHNKRNPGADYHMDVKHTLRKNLYLH
ncbi:CASP8 and FADD-like apoptosis regulator [Odontesthes bonariensis]|uniref:CASP8 and FADD-like apoptosis regulator n=1 Tax=Odontesthes bonariensis TaxID=219752 RepID=UPI003F5834C0